MTPTPCACCKAPLDALTAAGIDVDAYDFSGKIRWYRCPHCRAELEMVVPVVAVAGSWHWALKHEWLTAMLAKAWAYDREPPNKE